MPESTKALEVRKGPSGFGPLETLMEDPSVTDILVDNFDKIYVERKGKLEPTNLTFGSEAELRAHIDAILFK